MDLARSANNVPVVYASDLEVRPATGRASAGTSKPAPKDRAVGLKVRRSCSRPRATVIVASGLLLFTMLTCTLLYLQILLTVLFGVVITSLGAHIVYTHDSTVGASSVEDLCATTLPHKKGECIARNIVQLQRLQEELLIEESDVVDTFVEPTRKTTQQPEPAPPASILDTKVTLTHQGTGVSERLRPWYLLLHLLYFTLTASSCC